MLKHYLYLPKAEKQTGIFHGDAEGFPMAISQQDHYDSMPGVSSFLLKKLQTPDKK
jgi:hypothetical protein